MRQIHRTFPFKQKSIGFLFLILGIIIFLIKFISGSADNVGESPTLFYIGGNGEVISQFPVKDGESKLLSIF